MDGKCIFQGEHRQCLVMSAIRGGPHYTSGNICEVLCRGAEGTDNIVAYMSQRHRRKFVICGSVSEGEIVRCIKAGGLVAQLDNDNWLRSDEPVAPPPKRTIPPVTVMIKGLAQAAKQVIVKLAVDIDNQGLWQGLKGVVACKEQANMRWDKCENCPGDHLEKVNKEMPIALGPKLEFGKWRCLSFPGGEEGCGCFLPAKTWGAGWRCDKGFWDTIDEQFTQTPKGNPNGFNERSDT